MFRKLLTLMSFSVAIAGTLLYCPSAIIEKAHAAAATPTTRGPYPSIKVPESFTKTSTSNKSTKENSTPSKEEHKNFVRFRSHDEFVKTLLPYCIKVGERLGMDPKLVLAQAALETNWGRSIPKHSNGKSSHNLFGIKGNSKIGYGSISVKTREYRGGGIKRGTAKFRSYTCFQECFDDYADMIAGDRYQRKVQNAKSPLEYAKGLQRAGYATDPYYADKIMRIYKGPVLSKVNL